MFDHLSLGTNNFQQALVFFDAVLMPLECIRLENEADSAGYGKPEGLANFWISSEKTSPSQGFHLAFQAPSQLAVKAFHEAALAHGATDNGAPGLRPHYGPAYYAAYIITPDGHHLEAVHGR